MWFLSCYTKLWLNPARSYHRQVKDWGNWALGAALRPKTRHEAVQFHKKYMPYHSFFLGGAHRLQAFFGPVEWKEVSLIAISKTTGASYLQTNAPGSMHRPSPAGRPLCAPLPCTRTFACCQGRASRQIYSHLLKPQIRAFRAQLAVSPVG